MTPLIYVSLVLVVMLLLMTPLAFESSIAVHKSLASAKTAEEKEEDERIELQVVSDTDVRVNRKLVQRYELIKTLRPMLDSKTSRRVVVSCNDEVSHGAFVDVLDQAKMCGVEDIAVMGK